MSDSSIKEAMIVNQGESINLGIQIGKQYNYSPAQRQNLAEAAREIQALLDELSEKYPIDTTAQKAVLGTKVIEAIEVNPSLKDRIISAIQAGGITALQEAVDNPLFNILSSLL